MQTQLDPVKIAVVRAALLKMVTQGHFSICTVREVNAITGNVPYEEEMKMLQALHCVDYASFDPTLRDAFPKLLARALGYEDRVPEEFIPRPAGPVPTRSIPNNVNVPVHFTIVQEAAKPQRRGWFGL
jgi:hypothetical protein